VSDLVSMSYCPGLDDSGRQTYNVIEVVLADDRESGRAPRTTFASSACGICGAASLESVRVASPYDVATDGLEIDGVLLAALPDRLRSAQVVFDHTGGLHAAGLFTTDGDLLCVREDVGRHNAVDKVIGWALREGLLRCGPRAAGQRSGVVRAGAEGPRSPASRSSPRCRHRQPRRRAGRGGRPHACRFRAGRRVQPYSRPERVPARDRLCVSEPRGT